MCELVWVQRTVTSKFDIPVHSHFTILPAARENLSGAL
jgi:hypothetical protein